MARKLIAVAALVALVSLASAGAALAATYDLGKQGDPQVTWKHDYSNPKQPWSALTKFTGGSPTYQNWDNWNIGNSLSVQTRYLSNSKIGSYVLPGIETWGSFIVVFDLHEATPRFQLDGSKFSQVPDDIFIKSNDFTLTYSAEYWIQPTGNYTVRDGVLVGIGTNWNDGDSNPNNNPLFRITATLIDSTGNHYNEGYMPSFILDYNWDPNAVPLPAGIWLLGTGLLGLGLLGRRRRK